ncbi:MAG: phage portal protein [Magnetococcales bacterium]|nr:phage portal protein [Magnetococcales bacterium]MBF0152093.1 phage portal protein [Magnetococcales bacterium]
MGMNMLDRIVVAISPERGLRRVRARGAIDVLRREYDGAKTGRRTDGWITPGHDANAEIAIASTRLRNRARDLVRNNPFAAKAVITYASSMVGSGIRPRPKAESKVLDAQITSLWEDFSNQCDADGRTNFYGIQTLMVRSMVESGECLLQMINRPSSFGLAVPLQLRVLEADHLDVSRDQNLPGGGFIQQGIEFDSHGTRVAYWLYPQHPGSSNITAKTVSIRVPASDVVHLFDRMRPGQNRGVTWFAPALLRMRDLDDYDEAELMRKKIEACFVGFVINADPGQSLSIPKTEANEKRVESFEPGMVSYLPPGKDIRFGSPATTSGYVEYMRWHFHAVSAALGLTYELLTGDLSQVNYSSLRAGLIEFRRRIDAMQRQVLVPQLCTPVWNRFLSTAQAAGLVGDGKIRIQWTPPRFEAVDPQKDTMGEILMIRAGLMSLAEGIARQGYDPDVVTAEFAEMNKVLDQLGLVLDTDPRKSTRNGQQKQ